MLRKLRNRDFMMKLLVKYADYVTSKRTETQTLHQSTKHGCFITQKADSNRRNVLQKINWGITDKEYTKC